MTVRELRRVLFEVEDQDAEVRLAFQPNWPFEHSIGTIREVSLEDENVYDEEGDEYVEKVVYIGEGGQLGYLPNRAKQELEW